jgi:hypothetical protein
VSQEPRTIGAYEVIAPLGQGAMGLVYRVRHTPTGAERALKLMTGTPDENLRGRFEREAASLGRLSGQGVVPVHETGSFHGRPYYVMALMPGGSLASRLKARGKLPWREAAALAATLARALERCHAIDLVHRDLKPDNVLFDEQERPLLADFGCVRDLAALPLTKTGTLVGSIPYMAPEQLQGKKAGPAADIFALGAILHELVTGSPPHQGDSVYEVHARIEHRQRAPVNVLVGAPDALEAVIARALALEPGARQGSAGELARELDALAPGAGAPRTRRPLRALAPIAALAVVVALAVALARSGTEPRPADAVRALTAAARARSGSPDAVLAARAATILLDAMPWGEEARAIAPDAWATAARAELAWGDDVRAHDLATKALGLVPSDDPGAAVPLLLLRARAAIAARDPEAAVADLEGINEAEALRLRADLLVRLERWKELTTLPGDDPLVSSARLLGNLCLGGDRDAGERELRHLEESGAEALAAIRELDARHEIEGIAAKLVTPADVVNGGQEAWKPLAGAVAKLEATWRSPRRRWLSRAKDLAALEAALGVGALNPIAFRPAAGTRSHEDSIELTRALERTAGVIAGSPTDPDIAPHRIIATWILMVLGIPLQRSDPDARDLLRVDWVAAARGHLEPEVDFLALDLLASDAELAAARPGGSLEACIALWEAGAAIPPGGHTDIFGVDQRYAHEVQVARASARLASQAKAPEARLGHLARADLYAARALSRVADKDPIYTRIVFHTEIVVDFVRGADSLVEEKLAFCRRDPTFVFTIEAFMEGELRRKQKKPLEAEALFRRGVAELENEGLLSRRAYWHAYDLELALALAQLEIPEKHDAALERLLALQGEAEKHPAPFGWIADDVKRALGR